MSKRCLKERYDPKQYAFKQLLDRQLHEEYRRRRAQMLFDYYTDVSWLAQRVRPYNNQGLLLVDGSGKEHRQEGAGGTGGEGFGGADTAKESKGIYLVQPGNSRRMETDLPEPIQEQEDSEDVA